MYLVVYVLRYVCISVYSAVQCKNALPLCRTRMFLDVFCSKIAEIGSMLYKNMHAYADSAFIFEQFTRRTIIAYFRKYSVRVLWRNAALKLFNQIMLVANFLVFFIF